MREDSAYGKTGQPSQNGRSRGTRTRRRTPALTRNIPESALHAETQLSASATPRLLRRFAKT